MRRPAHGFRQLQSPQTDVARFLGELGGDVGIEHTPLRRPRRQERLGLFQIDAFAGDQFLVDKLRRGLFDQLFFFT